MKAAKTAQIGREYQFVKSGAYAAALRDRVPTLRRAWFTVAGEYKTRPADPGGMAIVGKAVVDGLVEAGVLRDDGPDHDMGELLLSSAGHPEDGLRITVSSTAPPWTSPARE